MFAVVRVIATTTVLSGWFSFYAPGVMARSVRNHFKYGHVQTATFEGCAVALPDCEDLGKTVWIRSGPGEEWISCLVGDCASKTDYQSETDRRSGYEWMLTEGIIAELDYETAQRIGRYGELSHECPYEYIPKYKWE